MAWQRYGDGALTWISGGAYRRTAHALLAHARMSVEHRHHLTITPVRRDVWQHRINGAAPKARARIFNNHMLRTVTAPALRRVASLSASPAQDGMVTAPSHHGGCISLYENNRAARACRVAANSYL